MQLERRPGHDGRLGDLGPQWMLDVGDHGFVVDSVGDHAVGQLAGQHGPQLVAGQLWVHVAKGQGVEAGVPVPDAHVLHLGGHHRLVLHPPQRGDQVVAHHPPGIVVVILEAFGDGGHAAEPVSPPPFGSGQRLGKGDRFAIQLEVVADVEVDGHVVAAVHDELDDIGLPFQAQLVSEHLAVGAIGQVAHSHRDCRHRRPAATSGC